MNVKFTIKVNKITNDMFNMVYNVGSTLTINEGINTLNVDLTSDYLDFSFGGTTTDRDLYCYDVISNLFIRPVEYNGVEDYNVFLVAQNRAWKKDGTENNKLFINSKAFTKGVGTDEECIIYIEINERLNNNTLLNNTESFEVRNTRTIYCDSTLNNLANLVNGENFSSSLSYLFTDPAEFVEYQMALPFDTRNLCYFDNSSDMNLKQNVIVGRTTFSMEAFKFTKAKSNIFIGSIKCERPYNDFRDYSPYTKTQLFIPYVGFITLDSSLVMGKTLRVYAILNVNDSATTIIISADNEMIQTIDTSLGVVFTMGSSNQIQRILGVAKGGTAGFIGGFIGGAKVGGVIGGAVGGAIGGGIGVITNMQEHYNKGNLTNSSTTFNNNQNLYIYMETPTVIEPQNFASLYGRPSNKIESLSKLTGYTVLDTFHLENFETATDTELSEIKELLQSGIIL